MRQKRNFILLLCIFVMICGLSIYWATEKRSIGSEHIEPGDIVGNGVYGVYLSEEEVFEALAFTHNDLELLSQIHASGDFHAEDYSKHTNDQYGGMYLDKDGNLVICYLNGSEMLSKAEISNEQYSGKLLDDSKNVIADSVIKSVKYSYTDLLEAFEYLNEKAIQYKVIKQFCIDIENNKIMIGVIPGSRIEKLKEELFPLFGEDMFSFSESDQSAVFLNYVPKISPL